MSAATDILHRHAEFLPRRIDTIAEELESFCALLAKWQQAQNLVSRETLADVWSRHVADSLQLLPLIRPNEQQIVDLGSGGGFPALPLAIVLKDTGRRFALIEPNARKAAFLRAAAREAGLGTIVVDTRRAEDIGVQGLGRVDLFTSRALARLDVLFGMMAPFWAETTRALLHKGREHVEELAAADSVWRARVLIHPSATETGAAILDVTELRLRTNTLDQ